MEKKQCRNCKSNEKVTDEQKAYALKVQAIMAKPILNRDKKKEIMSLPEYDEFSNLVGVEDLLYNDLPVEIQGVDIYRICMNEGQNKDAGIEGKNDIHKTYYTCEYWGDEND